MPLRRCFFCFLALLVSGCSLPRIFILDDPLTPEEHLTLAIAYEKEERYALAAAEYETAAKTLPVAYFYLGNLHARRLEYDAAARRYRRAMREMPDDPRAYNNLAWLLCTRGVDLDAAEKLAREALRLALRQGADAAPYRDTLDCVLSARPGSGGAEPNVESPAGPER